jgi:hypothetical protein
MALDNEKSVKQINVKNPKTVSSESKVINFLSSFVRWSIPVLLGILYFLLKCVEWAFNSKPPKKNELDRYCEAEIKYGKDKHWYD